METTYLMVNRKHISALPDGLPAGSTNKGCKRGRGLEEEQGTCSFLSPSLHQPSTAPPQQWGAFQQQLNPICNVTTLAEPVSFLQTHQSSAKAPPWWSGPKPTGPLLKGQHHWEQYLLLKGLSFNNNPKNLLCSPALQVASSFSQVLSLILMNFFTHINFKPIQQFFTFDYVTYVT